jgi:hypothetical protein
VAARRRLRDRRADRPALAAPDAALVLTGPWITGPGRGRGRRHRGYSDVWHFVYLTGLVGLAATVALFRDDIRRLIMMGSAFGW